MFETAIKNKKDKPVTGTLENRVFILSCLLGE
jgi:hypothetical protein